MRTDDQRTSHSPTPWMATADNGVDQPEGLSTVRESSGELQKSQARLRRRSRPRASQRGTETPWDTDDDEHLRLKGGRRTRRHRGEQGEGEASGGADVQPRMGAKMTEDELREQLGNLMRVCEQLLRERAERDGIPAALPGGSSSRSPRRHRGSRSATGRASSPSSVEMSRANSIHASPIRSRPPQMPVDASSTEASPARPSHHGHGVATSSKGEALASARSHVSRSSRSGGVRSSHDQVSPSVSHHHHDHHQETDSDWPDALAELLASSELDMPDGSHLVQAASRGVRSHLRPTPLSGLNVNEFDPPSSPFALQGGRGLALRRVSQSHWTGHGNYGPPVGSVWSGAHAASPLPMSRGGLNLQTNWPGVAPGRGYDVPAVGGDPGSFYAPQPQRTSGLGAGQVPIGIKPSIQAQSAMLRELYPHGPPGAVR